MNLNSMDTLDKQPPAIEPAVTPEDQKRNQQLQNHFEAAYQKFAKFLDDPQQVDFFNTHVESLLKDYPEAENFYQITPEHTATFKRRATLAKIDVSEEWINNACCSVSPNSETFSLDIIIRYGRNSFDRDKHSKEAEKTILHELMHGYHWGKRAEIYHTPLHEKFNSPLQKQLTELCCDAGADVIMPWPRRGDTRLQNELENRKTDIEKFRVNVAAENSDSSEVERLVEKFISLSYGKAGDPKPTLAPLSNEEKKETHPPVKHFMRNSEMITDGLMESRVNSYLERVYDGYVADHEMHKPIENHSFKQNEFDVVKIDQQIELSVPDQKPASTHKH